MILKEKWMEQLYSQFALVFPDASKKEINNFLSDKFDKEFKDTECICYNNYEKEEFRTTLSKLIDWEDSVKPILCESGTFFKKQSQCYNPNAIILQNKLNARKKAKAEMFRYLELKNKETDDSQREIYADLEKSEDLKQGRIKVIVNSEYGTGGMPSSFLFNLACAASTTLKAQTLISTAYNAFENFLADYVKFWDMDDCLIYIQNILEEKSARKLKDHKYVDKDVTKEELVARLKSKFKDVNNCDDWILIETINNITSQEDINRLYFKNNIYAFIRRSSITKDRIHSVIVNCKHFMDPTKPPKQVLKELNKVDKALLEYVHYNYAVYNRALRLETEKRAICKVIDTDSNMVLLSMWMDFIDNEVVTVDYSRIRRTPARMGKYYIADRKNTESYDDKYSEDQMFKGVNLMAYILGHMIDTTLAYYVKSCNVDDDAPGSTSMKNEFMFDDLLTTEAKKHYLATIRLKEGKYFKNVKREVKGLDFNKPSYASPYAREFNTSLAFDTVFDKNGVQLNKVISRVAEFEDEIHDSIMDGEFKFVKVNKIKKGEDYADPSRIGQYKAAYIWNKLYPEKAIEFPGRAYILKTKLDKKIRFADLSATDPEMFKKLTDLFDNDKMVKTGMTAIAIPLDSQVPEWVKPYINLDDIIVSNIKLSFPVMKSLGIKTVFKSKSSQFFSNIVSI